MEHSSLVTRRPFLVGALIVLIVAIAANVIALMATNPKLSGDGDGPFYISIARNLASGKGYVLGDSPWPDKPTMGRAPVWPALLSIPARLAPGLDDLTLLRGTAACLNAASAALLFAITFILSGQARVSIAAGVAYALYPVALALTAGGFSEIPYIFLAALGLLLVLRGGAALYVGALVLGLSPLVRSNFIALPVMVCLVALLRVTNRRGWKRFVVLAALFWIPSAVWIARNYALNGEFPVLSTIEGETLYGANNSYIASTLSIWGYWIFPNEIPGETAKKELAQTMSERQIDRYYHRKGMAFLRAHWFELPRLELGKLIRAFVPVPWVPGWTSYAVFFCRAVLYLGILINLRTFRRLDQRYTTLVTGMFLVVLLTVLVYYGTYRFTFCVEVFLLPAVVIGTFSRAGRLKSTLFSKPEPALLDAR